MIRVQNVSKIYPTRFGEKLVLDDISFNLDHGEKLGVLGRNGAGKSTLVRLISGAELPTKGRIDTSMSVSWPLAFGGAFQDTLTGVDNIRFISRIYNQDFEKNLAFVEDFSELGAYLREEVRTYSSGMRARLAFAISMIIEFDCFLIDEVGAVGDARFHQRCNKELFGNRGDRAMVIISHDASYVRDHCTRFAVLNDGQMVEFDDFETAYSDFREKIGIGQKKQPKTQELPADRRQLVETTHSVAVRDDAFTVLIQDADWKRDQKRWEEAEVTYEKALDLYPYQRSYWVQKGHCAKEAGAFLRAEAAYRTACALGEPFQDVRPHLLFTTKQLRISLRDYPLHNYTGTTAKDQPAGIPDVLLFARAAWQTAHLSDQELLDLVRAGETLDALLASMIDDPRFVPGIAPESNAAQKISGEPEVWAKNLVVLARPSSASEDAIAVARRITMPQDAWPVLMDVDGFAGWSLAQAAIERRSKADG
ncbi:hypothetical protein EH31_06000 [Erythrobacter longus]|uniref:ABC transporter domain-containing protein n=1 Tax=Erythrobacter longus TaxID=1044 RepID=A0A074N2P9_ERYLO|nr:hypothetical protein EH31_06000 [Erythrobacter longus]